MAENNSATLFPCPFSKGYGIPAQQAWSLLKIFLIYRLILASLFTILLYSRLENELLGHFHNDLYIYSSQTYLILTILSVICIFWRIISYASQAQLLIFTDIVLLTLLMHACGGIKSGIGILLAVSIAAGGLLIGGRCSLLFAALASLAVLTEQVVTSNYRNFDTSFYTYAGMLGAAFFTIAMLSYILAKRGEETLQIADQHMQTITKLEDLNKYIIQHLQSGIIIVNQQHVIQAFNKAALRLTNLVAQPNDISDISVHLKYAFKAWLIKPDHDTLSLQIPDQAEIHCRFVKLPTDYETFYMIVLEDNTLYNQRLQQSKLASLGQLTASIAHEIRNPLGAISHAGQLLAENHDLSDQDQRLLAIIQNHTKRVNQIIEDILQLSRRGESRQEKIQLNTWLETYLNNLMLENEKDVEHFQLIAADKPVNVFIDPGHLKQILDNLCQNALRYGKPELGKITLRPFYLTGKSPCLEITDNGPAISLENLKHLFEPFYTTSSTGVGLGLYISRELAELNQAKLSYHVNNNGCSCFRLCLLDAEQKLIEI
jgi:two-component system sensor histidine kinase PilS (NtrC family)